MSRAALPAITSDVYKIAAPRGDDRREHAEGGPDGRMRSAELPLSEKAVPWQIRGSGVTIEHDVA